MDNTAAKKHSKTKVQIYQRSKASDEHSQEVKSNNKSYVETPTEEQAQPFDTQGVMAVIPTFSTLSLPTSSLRPPKIDRESNEKGFSESSPSKQYLSESRLIPSSNQVKPSSPPQRPSKVFLPSSKKRPSDDSATQFSKSHMRGLGEPLTAFNRDATLEMQHSLHSDPIRDAIGSRASPGQVPTDSTRCSPSSRGIHKLKVRRIHKLKVRRGAQADLAAQVPDFSPEPISEPKTFRPSVGSHPLRSLERDSGLVLQPETRPITQDQLVSEVKGMQSPILSERIMA